MISTHVQIVKERKRKKGKEVYWKKEIDREKKTDYICYP